MSVVSNASEFGKVAVLYGGESGERPVSLNSGRAVHAALCTRGVDAHLFDTAEQAITMLPERGFARVWNALHGGAGENGTVQGALNMLGMPFTGSGVLGSALSMDKARSKSLLAAAGVSVAGGEVIGIGSGVLPTLPMPVFVKPVSGGSSLGAQPVLRAADLADAVSTVHALGDAALVEPLLTGPEYTIGILQGDALPAIRIDVDSEFYDYDAKYVSDATRYVCPALEANDPLAVRMAQAALRAFDVLGCEGWGRVDFMLDGDGIPLAMEVNTVPGMTDHSLVPCAAAAAGIDFERLCWRVLETSMRSEVVHG
ncbi:MAG: D-alanine--D-alanine ligase [Pseudomonadota bacterium]